MVFVLKQKDHPKFKGDDLIVKQASTLGEAHSGSLCISTHLANKLLRIKSQSLSAR